MLVSGTCKGPGCPAVSTRRDLMIMYFDSSCFGFARASEIRRKNEKKTQKTRKRMVKSIFPTSETTPRFCATVWRGRRKTHHTQQHNTNNKRRQGSRLVHAPNQ